MNNARTKNFASFFQYFKYYFVPKWWKAMYENDIIQVHVTICSSDGDIDISDGIDVYDSLRMFERLSYDHKGSKS